MIDPLINTNQSLQPNSTPIPIPPTSSPISPQPASSNEQVVPRLPSPVRFKGSAHVFKRRQTIVDSQPASTSDLSLGMESTQPLDSTLPNPVSNDLD